jgi:hypothetical protein
VLIGAAIAVVVCGVAVAAYAFEHVYRGALPDQPAASVRFRLVQHPGHGEFVKPFVFHHIRLTCALGPSHIVINEGRFRRIPVADDQFAASKHPSDVSYQVKGKLASGGHAHGRIVVNEDAAMCSSGILNWHARTG